MLYLLKRENLYWDELADVVVRASSEEEARQVVDALVRSEFQDVSLEWLDPSKTTCEIVPDEGKPEVILQNVRWG